MTASHPTYCEVARLSTSVIMVGVGRAPSRCDLPDNHDRVHSIFQVVCFKFVAIRKKKNRKATQWQVTLMCVFHGKE